MKENHISKPSGVPVPTEIVGVRFKEGGKVYHFAPSGKFYPLGLRVVVDTASGEQIGDVASENKVSPRSPEPPLKPVLREATADDIKRDNQNRLRIADLRRIFNEKIAKHNLPMTPTEIEVAFDGNKVTFYFSSPHRVDFRLLVRDLAAACGARIELRQIGVRDEAKRIGGLGACGRGLCCKDFLSDFQPVSIKMAKEQSLSLNPVKISGYCGRLMCCLKYEQDSYEELIKLTPPQGSLVETPEGRGMVVDANLLTGKMKVRLDDRRDTAPFECLRDDVKVIRRAEIRLSKEELEQAKQISDPLVLGR